MTKTETIQLDLPLETMYTIFRAVAAKFGGNEVYEEYMDRVEEGSHPRDAIADSFFSVFAGYALKHDLGLLSEYEEGLNVTISGCYLMTEPHRVTEAQVKPSSVIFEEDNLQR